VGQRQSDGLFYGYNFEHVSISPLTITIY